MNCIPLAALPPWVSRHSLLCSLAGIVLVPSVATLGAAFVAYVDVLHGAPLSQFIAGAYVALGAACCLTSGTLIRAHVHVRRALAGIR
jgi:hypothetical protein